MKTDRRGYFPQPSHPTGQDRCPRFSVNKAMSSSGLKHLSSMGVASVKEISARLT
jgi:hypothetical protein